MTKQTSMTTKKFRQKTGSSVSSVRIASGSKLFRISVLSSYLTQLTQLSLVNDPNLSIFINTLLIILKNRVIEVYICYKRGSSVSSVRRHRFFSYIIFLLSALHFLTELSDRIRKFRQMNGIDATDATFTHSLVNL